MKSFLFLLLSPVLACGQVYATGQAARMIIGQPNFTQQEGDTSSAYELGACAGVAWANNTLFIADDNRVQATPENDRVLIYNNISSFVIPPTAQVPNQGIRCPVCGGSPDTLQANVVLGQPDFVTFTTGVANNLMQTPTAVASNGQILAVADTNNNRVLIWNSIPQTINRPADIVLGQPDFNTVVQPPVLDNKSLRGPQGVWIQGSRFFVADTQNHRVMVWNSIPTKNYQTADYVLGEPNFTTAPSDLNYNNPATASNMLNPVSVTSDGVRLYVTDLGHTRVMIWNSIPTQNGQAADIAVGQPDLVSNTDNNSTVLCPSNGVDTNNNPTYPQRCGATLSFPRFALSDGTRLYVADGGNDRVLIFNKIPTASGAEADVTLGEPDEWSDNVTDSIDTFQPDANIERSASDSLRTPMALAWDGTNLYVADAFDRRVVVFTPGANLIPLTGITNSASMAVYAAGTLDFSGTITANDTITVTIDSATYMYTVVSTDTLDTIIAKIIGLINAGFGDPNVFAIDNAGFLEIILSSKIPGIAGNATTYSVATSTTPTTATETVTAGGANLTGGQNAAEVGPGTLVTMTGTNLSDTTASAPPGKPLPLTLGGVQVFFDGIQSPLAFVSPTQINTQVPFSVQDANGVSSFVLIHHNDGTVTNTTALNIPIVFANPGVFAAQGQDPRPVMAYHASSYALAVVDVDGTINAGDVATIMVQDRTYNYTVQAGDSLEVVRDAMIAIVNANPEEIVTATAAGQFTRIILTAKVAGPDGAGIMITATQPSGASILLTALQNQTCCANVAGAPVTQENPAVPGELITLYAAGLGQVQPDEASLAAQAGLPYVGPPNAPTTPVDDAQAGGSTANVLNAGLAPGMVGVYAVQIQLSTALPTNLNTQVFIAQSVFTSNIVTMPVVNPSPLTTLTSTSEAETNSRPNPKSKSKRK